jgi:predicted dehydrogenase
MTKIGMLSFAHLHAYSYAACLKNVPDVELVGIWDDSATRGRKAATQFATKFYADRDKLLDTDIDGVIVCSENAKHRALAVAAAKAGKHILCEKPIATTIKHAQDMIAAARSNNVKLQIAFPCRFATPSVEVKKVIESGQIGEVLAVCCTNHGSYPGGWFGDKKLAGGGAVMDHTVHVADLLRWMLKREIVSVYAEVASRLHNIKIDDCGMLNLELEGGIIATQDPSWSRLKCFPTWGDVTMEFVGDKGVIHLDLFKQKFDFYSVKETKSLWVYWGDNMDQGLINDFVGMIREGREPSITGEDGLKALEVTLAAYLSAKKGEKVSLPLA